MDAEMSMPNSAAMQPRDQALKRATRALVEAADGCEMAARLCRVGKSQLAAAGCINQPDRWLPVDALRDLMAVTRGHAGAVQLLAHLAAEAGFALVPVEQLGGIDPLSAIAELSKESAALLAGLAVMAGGASNHRRIIVDCDNVMAKTAAIRAAADQLEKGVL
jgi:hypothetical protein